MAIPLTGTISLTDIQTEFGGTDPISLSEYYKGGAYVLTTDYAPNVPTSGFVSLQFEQDQWSSIKNGRILKTIFPKDLK